MEDYRLLVGTKIDTKGIQGQLNLIKNKYITVNVKINEVGIQRQLTKLQKKYITADVKLNKQGLQKQLNEVASDKTIKLKTEIDKSKGLGNLSTDTTNLNKSTRDLQKNLIWKSKSSKKNQDDISDAICVAYSQIKPRKTFGRK